MWKRFLIKIVDGHNHLSDKNYIWFPFVFLRPLPTERITMRRILVMTLCFSIYGFIFLAIRQWLNKEFELEDWLKKSGMIVIVFFVWFNLVTARLWNYRSDKLNKGVDE
jgi:hypothetical protein